jgi:hypothetical protein
MLIGSADKVNNNKMVVRHPPLNVRTWNKKLRRQFVNQRRRAKTGKPKMAATDTNSELLPVDRNG